jgi:predicted ester cyclase
LVGCSSSTESELSRNKELVREYFEVVVSTGAVDRMDEYISEEYVEVHEGTRYPLGVEGAREHIDGIRRVFPDLQISVQRQVAEGEWVVSQITVEGTHLGEWMGMAPTERRLQFTGVNVNRVVGGKIIEHGGAANLLGPLLEAEAVRLASGGEDPS